jgi:hypothetical protein
VKAIKWEIHFSVLFDIYRKVGESRGHGDKEIKETEKQGDSETRRSGTQRDRETRRY